MRYIFLPVCLLFYIQVSAQEKQYRNDTVMDGKVYSYVEQMPKSGYDFNDYFNKNFHYPDIALKDVEGRAVVKFIVNEDGTISDCQVIKGDALAKEMLRVVRAMPKWIPGKQNGKPVKCWFSLPISVEPE